MCANGAETPRLLLMSQSNLFPNGLANSSGLVGKYLMLEATAGALGTFEHPLNEYKSVQVTRVLHDFYDSDPKRGFYGSGGLDARFDFYPIGYALYAMPPDAPRWGWFQGSWERKLQPDAQRFRAHNGFTFVFNQHQPGSRYERCLGHARAARHLQEPT